MNNIYRSRNHHQHGKQGLIATHHIDEENKNLQLLMQL
jgi:hypothetical protein